MDFSLDFCKNCVEAEATVARGNDLGGGILARIQGGAGLLQVFGTVVMDPVSGIILRGENGYNQVDVAGLCVAAPAGELLPDFCVQLGSVKSKALTVGRI